jgi:cyclin-dependent kinase 9
MAEMFTREHITQGNTEQQQLKLISELCGSIIPEVWQGLEASRLYNVCELPKEQKHQVCECKGSWPFAFGSG